MSEVEALREGHKKRVLRAGPTDDTVFRCSACCELWPCRVWLLAELERLRIELGFQKEGYEEIQVGMFKQIKGLLTQVAEAERLQKLVEAARELQRVVRMPDSDQAIVPMWAWRALDTALEDRR